MDVTDYREKLSSIYGQRKWITAMDVMASATGTVKTLQELGALECFCIAGSSGTGPTPDPAFATHQHTLDVTGETLMDSIRNSMRAMQTLPNHVIEALDTFDPTKQARVLGPIFDSGAPVAGRRKFGRRPSAWQALEDKTVIDQLWVDLNLPHAPFQVVDATQQTMLDAAAALDVGHGTVWSADNSEGFHGGAQFVRWVRTEDAKKDACVFFAKHSQRIRIAPFMEGIPCSIHAMVFRDQTITFRPCEMLVLRDRTNDRFQYASTSTYWDPPQTDRDQMRAMARIVGEHLRQTVDYRGMLTIDGIMTQDGFLPTELNPRIGAAVGRLCAGIPELPMVLLNNAVVEDVDIDWHPEVLEAMILDVADELRSGLATCMTQRKVEVPVETYIRWDDGECRACDQSQSHGRATLGPSPMGGIVLVRFLPEHTTVGASLAPKVASAFNMLNARWDLKWHELTAAHSVRQ